MTVSKRKIHKKEVWLDNKQIPKNSESYKNINMSLSGSFVTRDQVTAWRHHIKPNARKGHVNNEESIHLFVQNLSKTSFN